MRFLAFLLAAVLLASPATAAQAKEPASQWIIQQKSEETGDHTVYISADAVKIVCETEGYYVLAKAPDWQVHCCRPDTKALWIGPLDQFNGTIMINPFAVPCFNGRALVAFGKTTYSGLKCTKFRPPTLQYPVIYGADEIAACPKACEFICRYYFVAQIHEIPLYHMIYAIPRAPKGGNAVPAWLDADVGQDLRSGQRVVLQTKSWKKLAFNQADFEYPKDYKRVKEINQVGYSDARRDALGDMMGEIGFTTADKKEAKKTAPARK